MGPVISNPVLDAPDVIDVDLPCAVCGYNLRSIRRDAVCTECGTAVLRSLGRDNALWEARPAWLRSLSCGVWMMIAAQAILAASFIGMFIAPRTVERFFDDPRIVICALLALAVLHTAGAWLLTRRERLFVPPPTSDTLIRLTARVGMFGPLAAILTFIGFFIYQTVAPQTAFHFCAATMALVVPGVLATYWHLRGLARRVLSRRMSEYATIVAIGGAVTVLVLIAWFIAALNDVYLDVSKTAVFLCILLACTAAMLFYLWSLVVLAMFAASFARASRAAHALWNQHAVA